MQLLRLEAGRNRFSESAFRAEFLEKNSIVVHDEGGNCGAIYRRGSEGRTQSTGSNMTISDMHSWISRTTTWVDVVVSDKYVLGTELQCKLRVG